MFLKGKLISLYANISFSVLSIIKAAIYSKEVHRFLNELLEYLLPKSAK